ncbi:lipid A biosynthesis acyltransferase [Hydrogenophaga sp.]|uniref:lysophospholipid acyltransferase family protein n=1 Tax=Hydrogenophaga sp. TaxID=1904254 RepID=UPI001988A0E0|nr:lipid A biosynthesis acyltransferase [Hydrogenophaga sp.]MBD3893427.1 lipid A biosynthesis acyltransferase [Hydrogenophaga sp.]
MSLKSLYQHAVLPWLRRCGNRFGLGFMRLMARLPLTWVRGIGWLLGRVLHVLVRRRRRIARANWALCFPHQSAQQVRLAVRRHFVLYAQAWLDRGWLWGADEATVRSRLHLVGALHELQGSAPTLIFAPHFLGMDAGGSALALGVQRPFASVYTRQRNAAVDRWLRAGRLRFGQGQLIERRQGLRGAVQALRAGAALYILPDMDMGRQGSVFVPFFGIPAATVPTLARLARLTSAKVVPVISRLTPQGYEVQVLPAWSDYPGVDVQADTALMNQRLEHMILTMPEQYYWVHRRFKTRPPGEPPLYPTGL